MAKQGRGSEQAMIRLPDGMRDELKAQAVSNGRSMNAEIVARLESSFNPSSQMIVNSLIKFREELLSQGISVTLTGEKAEFIVAEAEKLKITPNEYFNVLINKALDHIENDTPTGKRLQQKLSE